MKGVVENEEQRELSLLKNTILLQTLVELYGWLERFISQSSDTIYPR